MAKGAIFVVKLFMFNGGKVVALQKEQKKREKDKSEDIFNWKFLHQTAFMSAVEFC